MILPFDTHKVSFVSCDPYPSPDLCKPQLFLEERQHYSYQLFNCNQVYIYTLSYCPQSTFCQYRSLFWTTCCVRSNLSSTWKWELVLDPIAHQGFFSCGESFWDFSCPFQWQTFTGTISNHERNITEVTVSFLLRNSLVSEDIYSFTPEAALCCMEYWEWELLPGPKMITVVIIW